MSRLLTLSLLCFAATLHAGVIDFEDAAAYGGDDVAIEASYFQAQGYNFNAVAGASAADVTDVVFAFEQVGRDGTDGFWNKGGSGRDEALAGDLGNYFLKAGTGNLAYNKAKYFKLDIDYTTVSTAASGEIWDIDGPEQYQVSAYNADGGLINSLTSPHGGLDGKPWAFAFSVDPESGQVIDRIEIEASGTGTLRGFAFDNFDAFGLSSATHATPLPAALPLGIMGIGVFVASRRHLRRENDLDENEEA